MSEGKKQRQLKNFFIYPEFQAKLLIMMVALSLITPFCLFILQSYIFQLMLDTGVENNWPETHPYFTFVHQFQDIYLLVLGSSVVVSFILILFFGVSISHKIFGPAVKLIKHFNDVADGKVEDKEIGFRKGDFLHELATAYNRRFKKTSQPEA